MRNKAVSTTELSVASLVKVADYLSRPQQFLAIAEARAGFKEALQEAGKRSVILTNNGAPQAALVPFETLEAMRSALLQLLVGEMNKSFEGLQKGAIAESDTDAEPTSEEELEALVKEARREAKKRKPKH